MRPSRPARLTILAVLITALGAALAPLPLYPPQVAAGAPTAAPPSRPPLPDTPVGVQLGWALGLLNGDPTAITAEDLAAHFTADLFAILPPEQLVGVVQQLAALGPFTLQGFTRPPLATQAIALLAGADGVPFVLPIAVETAPPHRITGFNLAPVPPPPGVALRPYAPGAEPDRFDGFVDIGGRRLYLSCSGSGGPTVVLESGLADPAAPWFAVERAVARFTRVWTYDRANALAGASDPAPTPRTGREVAADLHALLQAAGVPGPYVLVGHSIGGHFIRLFAAAHPAEVAGLVLVDASHEEEEARLEAIVPPELWTAFRAMLAQFPNPEGIDLAASAAQVRAARAATPLPPVPLVVLTAGQPQDPSLFPPGWPLEAEARLWQELQADLAGLLPGGQRVIAEQSGHYIHQAEPALVIDAIRDVVEAARQQGPAQPKR